MTIDQVRDHALHLAALYGMLMADMHRHDVDAHNLCSAVVERSGRIVGVYFSYSNPSALPAPVRAAYNFVEGRGIAKLIDRGGMQDLHTEIRLINHLYASGELTAGTVVSFFSSRSCCATCRSAILSTMQLLSGSIALMAYEFKA